MKLNRKQQDDALRYAEKLAEKSDERTVSEAIGKAVKFKDHPAIRKIWDHVQILIEVIKSPLFQRTVTFGAVAAILYLVSPIDIIPDVIVGIGLIDDAFILSTMLAGVVSNIKKDPLKAAEFIDSLPPHLKSTASKLFGITAGAFAGYKAGEAAGDFLKEHKLTDTLENVITREETLDEFIEREKEEVKKQGVALISKEIRKKIKTSFRERVTKSLVILALTLLAVILTLSPIFGQASKYIASALLLFGYFMTGFGILNFLIRVCPYIKSCFKERSIVKGVEKKLLDEFAVLRKGKAILTKIADRFSIPIEITPEELRKLAIFLIKSFFREILLYACGTGAIVLGFMAVRLMLVGQSVSLTPLKLLLFPFYS
ncbi:MAG: YkvA family protein [Bullifex sp.]